MATSNTFVNDFVGLPIIISDFDALTSTPNNGTVEAPAPAVRQSSASFTVSHAYSSSTTSSALQQNWTTGFSEFADGLWAKMTQGMKLKLREACVEVLKKTEDAEPEHMSWQYDDDARFLD